MSEISESAAKKIAAGAAGQRPAAPAINRAQDNLEVLMPLIAALADQVFRELHEDELGAFDLRVLPVGLGLAMLSAVVLLFRWGVF